MVEDSIQPKVLNNGGKCASLRGWKAQGTSWCTGELRTRHKLCTPLVCTELHRSMRCSESRPIWFRSVFCFQSVSRMTEGEHMLRIKQTLCIFFLFFSFLHCQDASLSHSNLNFQAFWCFPRNVFFNYLTIFTWFPNVFSNAEHMNYSTRHKCIFFVFFSCPFFFVC